MNKYLRDEFGVQNFINDFIEFCKPYKDYDDKDSNESVFIEDLKYFLESNNADKIAPELFKEVKDIEKWKLKRK